MRSKMIFRVAGFAALFGVLAVFRVTAAPTVPATVALPLLEPADASLHAAVFPSHSTTEMRVNTYTDDRQEDPSLAIDARGRILVAWGSRRQEFGTYGIFAQLLDPLGRPCGAEIHVNEMLAGQQIEPSVGFAPDGSAWIAWCSTGQDGSLGGVFMRRLDLCPATDDAGHPFETLTPVGEEIPVNMTTRGEQTDPVVSVQDDGGITVAWLSDHPGTQKAFGRVFDAQGRALGDEFRLGTEGEGWESLPSLARLPGGLTVAVWARHLPDRNDRAIHGRLFGPDGRPAGDEFRVSDPDGRDHVEPSVDSDGSGRFVVTWMSVPKDGTGEYRVTARRFTSTAEPIGPLWILEPDGTGYVNGATAVTAPDSRFLLAWNIHHEKTARTDGHRPDRSVSIHGQLYDAEGNPVGTPFRLNRFDEGEQTLQVGLNARHATWSKLDQIALAWSGAIEEDRRGVGLTLYTPEGLNADAPPVVLPMAAVDFSLAQYERERTAPPEWNPNWVDDSYLPMLPPAGPDFGFEAFQSTAWTPPDPELAVGPNHIVGVVNIWIRFFDKNGNILFDQDLADFFGSTSFSFDPIAMFDPLVNRFVVASAEHDPSGQDYLNIAVSDDDNPLGDWYTYRFYIGSYCDYVDFPNLGSDADAYYIATDCFGYPGGNHIHIFEKAPMLVGDPITLRNLSTAGGFISLGSSKGYDTDAPAAYFASAHAAGSPNVKIYAVTNPTGTPQLHSVNVNVGSFSQPPDAEQDGSSNRVDTIDYRIKNGVVRDGILYVTHNVNGGDGAAKARWYKIDLQGWPLSGYTPVKVDGGDVDPGFNIDTWFGDVNVDAGGNLAIAVNRSSPDEKVGVYRTFRLATDPAGVMRPTVELQTSTTPETGSRWGDYGGLEEDPAEPGTFWNHHEYRTSSWRTWMGHFPIEAGIKLSNLTPLIPGSPAVFEVSNVAPGEQVWFLYSLAGEGEGPCIPRLGDLCLDILEPIVVFGTAIADDSGIASLEVNVPLAAPPVQVWFQSVIHRGPGGENSVASNVTTDTIQ